jgi:hypothetical protein
MIILKFDDMMYPFTPEWQRVYELLKKFKIKACFGAVSDWCYEFIDLDYDLIEIWYHGKTHLFIEETGISEFCGPSHKDQQSNFSQGLMKLNNLCAERITTFGPATNRWDTNAISVVNASDQIETVCFCSLKDKIEKTRFTLEEHLNELWLPRNIVNNKKVGANELIDPLFYNRLDRMQLNIIPFHPGVGPWSEKSFINFEYFLGFIKHIKVGNFRDVKNIKQYKKLYI